MVDRFLVSDELLAEAAIEFIHLDNERRGARKEFRALQEVKPCLAANEYMHSCLEGLKLQRLLSKAEFCPNCALLQDVYRGVRSLSARRNGKLRHLRSVVQKRDQSNEKAEQELTEM